MIADADAQAFVDGYRKKLDEGTPIADLDPDFKDEFAVDWTKHFGAARSSWSRPALRRTSSPSSIT